MYQPLTKKKKNNYLRFLSVIQNNKNAEYSIIFGKINKSKIGNSQDKINSIM